MFNRKGFTLVELMIVVAIIGILAAIAIPNFVAMQYRAKRAEIPANVDGIKTAELAYEASFDQFVDTLADDGMRPEGDFGKEQRPWDNPEGFDTLGWAPDGDVRGVYGVKAGTTVFHANGECDVDGDGNAAAYRATNDSNVTQVEGGPNTY